MKKHPFLFLAIAFMTSCAITTVNPDEEAIRVDTLGAKREVTTSNIVVGRITYNPFTEDIIVFPVRLQRVEWKAEDNLKFQSKEGLSLSADVAFSMAFERGKTPNIYSKYGKQSPDIIDTVGRDIVRDAVTSVASQYSAMEINGTKRPEFQLKVAQAIRERLSKEFIQVDNFMFTGQIILPREVKQSIDAAQQATQIAIQRENEIRATRAEAEKRRLQADTRAYEIITKAKADAEAAKLKAKTITPQLVQYEAIQKWDGKLPTYSGGTVPFVQLK
ncbi:prohibitin family protein [Deinococcus misasensis]|uniref:prohibitin family protein n=1 Tax=Deinococcus misasensis TaxID=392413 RepID=UPI00054EB244|nr:prohibitin family protein [Deinococcus misasensis]